MQELFSSALPTRAYGRWARTAAFLLVLGSGNALAIDEPSPLEKSLVLARWTESRFAKFADGEPLTIDEQLESWRLARRLSSFNRRLLAGERVPEIVARDLLSEPATHRGRAVRMTGRVVAMERQSLDREAKRTFGVEAFYELRVEGEGGAFLVVTPKIPKAWLGMASFDQPVALVGLFLKNCATDGENLLPFVVTPRIAWTPIRPDPPHVNFGMSVLGALGVDVGKLDSVQQRKPLVAEDSDAFYEILAGIRTIGARQLLRSAVRRLPEHGRLWEEKREAAEASGKAKRKALAVEVVSQAKEDRYSVAPFFNDPGSHVGQLVTFDGLCRRAVRIVLDDPATVSATGVDHYFELDLYTDDSQHLPLVFCMLEVPPGFSLGENLHEPVRVAGFFFKSWRYSTRQAVADPRRTFPLFIGRAPLQLVEAKDSSLWGWGAGIGFAGLIAAVWFAQWRWTRADRQFAATTLTRLSQPVEPLDFSEGVKSSEGE